MTTHPFSLEGGTVLVVGASSGISAATARLTESLGAHVLLSSRSTNALKSVLETLENPNNAQVVALDYLDSTSVEKALSAFSRIGHVVIPAVADENKKRGAFLELSDETMRKSFDKFWGQINVLRATLPKMPAGGSAVLFSSIAGIRPTDKGSGLSVMNSVQAGIIQLGRSLALKVAPVRINIIAPGAVLTNVWTESERQDLSEWMKNSLPVACTGEAEDVAQAVVSLLTNKYITGSVLTVDGGLHLK